MAFKAPCDCNAVAGLKVYFPNEAGIATSQVFLFADAHGNNLTGIGHLFRTGAIVKVILHMDEGKAYIQNADTNAYLEGKFEGKADLVDGKVPAEQLPAMDYIPTKEKGAVSGVATLGADGKVPTGQLPSVGYSKAETLNDATKTLFGLSADGVPDDVFQKIKETFDNLRDFSKFAVEKISTSVNWTAPKATGQIFKVFVVGGGGGGGGSNGAGGGGGGGGYVEVAELTITAGTVIPIVCGAGGAHGGDGGATSFGSLLSAAGGKKGGDGVNGGNGGTGGAGGAGGGGGRPYTTADVDPGGAGGVCGGGGGAGGQNNRTYGAGGAGGLHGGGGGGSTGGAGGTYGGKGGSNAAGTAGATLGATQMDTLGNTMTGDGGAGAKNSGSGGGGGHGGNGGAGGS